jgi:2-dehydropantoate 2-reductase
VIAVKGQSLPDVAAQLQPLLESDTLVLPAMNGVPWWFGRGLPLLDGAPLGCVDPNGTVSRAIPLEQVIGCAVYAGALTLEPGLAEHTVGRKLTIGEPMGGTSERVQGLGGVLTRAGFDVTLSGHVRRDIWSKLCINLTVNPVSALTGAPTDRLLDDPLVREFCHATMREASAVGAAIGCAAEHAPEDRLAMMRKLGRIKPSMLLDVEDGRMLELDALVGALREIAQRIGVATPNVDALLGITRLFARTRGLYPA